MTRPLDLNEIALPWELVSRDTEKRLRKAEINNLNQALDMSHQGLLGLPRVGICAAKEVNAIRITVRLLAGYVRRAWPPAPEPPSLTALQAQATRAGGAALLTTMTAVAALAKVIGESAVERNMQEAISGFLGPDAKTQKGKS